MKVEDGENLVLALGDPSIVVGCATSLKFGRAREAKNATCTASQGTKETRPGQKSYSLTTEGLQRVPSSAAEAAANVTITSLEKAFEDGTILNFEFGSDSPGANKTSGTCYILSLDKTGGIGADATFSATFEVTGPVEDTLNPY